MFTRLISEHFKCLGSFDRRLAPLTLLTGFNAAGKSSTIQLLALLRQTAVENEWGTALQLNGSSVHLGTMLDVIDRNAGGAGFSVGLHAAEWSAQWGVISAERARATVGALDSVTVAAGERTWTWSASDTERGPLRRLVPEAAFRNGGPGERIQLQLASSCHVGAERIGPREVYAAATPLAFPDVGSQGEKTPLCLDQFGEAPSNRGTELDGVAPVVRLQVNGWMGTLFPGFGYEIRLVDGANLMTLGVRTSPQGDFFRPANVGFGITHVLPIITACVAGVPGQTIMIENPESHLHPSGQSMVGYFLARAASAGTQVVVETHSDHVLNGVRRAIRDQKIAARDVVIYFFRGETGAEGEPVTKIEEVVVDDTGRVAAWPDGFFDQIESDLDHLHSD